MKRTNPFLTGITAAFFAGFTALGTLPLHAQDQAEAPVASLTILDAASLTLEEFLWQARLIVVFADSPLDPRFSDQIAKLEADPQALIERDVVVITDTAPQTPSALREALHPRGFSMVLIGKDGEIRLRKPFAWDVREISRSIDKIPLRQQEVHDRRTGE